MVVVRVVRDAVQDRLVRGGRIAGRRDRRSKEEVERVPLRRVALERGQQLNAGGIEA